MPMKIMDVGEFGAIRLLTEIVTSERRGPGNAAQHELELLVDAGDDTAAWRCGRATQLYTTDTAVEGIHFTRETTPWYDLGWKIMAANVSDIAAMGGLPIYALVTLGLPPDTEMDELESLYRGMVALANMYGAAIVGGDTVRSPVAFVTVGLTGHIEGSPMLRSTARQGDLVAVTGNLGSSAGGLKIMLEGLTVQGEADKYLKASHRRPEPCVSQGRTLSTHGVRTAMDISDGLVDDLSKMCQASGVAAKLEADKIPVHPGLIAVFPQQYMDITLGGGEDYQLLFGAPRELMDLVLPLLPAPAAVIGEFVAGEVGQVTVVDSRTEETVKAPHRGWDHFSPVANESAG